MKFSDLPIGSLFTRQQLPAYVCLKVSDKEAVVWRNSAVADYDADTDVNEIKVVKAETD